MSPGGATGIRFEAAVPQFTVPNLVGTAEYYRDVLGFQRTLEERRFVHPCPLGRSLIAGLHAPLRLTRFPGKVSGHQEGCALVSEGATDVVPRVPRWSYSRGGWQWRESRSPPRRSLNG